MAVFKSLSQAEENRRRAVLEQTSSPAYNKARKAERFYLVLRYYIRNGGKHSSRMVESYGNVFGRGDYWLALNGYLEHFAINPDIQAILTHYDFIFVGHDE